MRLAEISIRALSVEKGQKTFFDDTLKGFGVRVSQGGTKSYVLMYGKERKLTTIGRVERLPDADEVPRLGIGERQILLEVSSRPSGCSSTIEYSSPRRSPNRHE
jgi:hypothetical protein